MTDRELMQQALDALEVSTDWDMGATGKQAQSIRAITALRARLAQPEQEPVAWGVPNTRPTEKAQFMMLLHSADGCQYPDQLVPLYTAPPQREWQNAALRLGEELSTVGPDGYYNISASEWLDWAMKHITPARIEQEPVAWITDGGKGELWWYQSSKFDEEGNLIGKNPEDIPLYEAPPMRQWQGLTDEDIEQIHYGIKCKGIGAYSTNDIYRAIEAKLKEKNT